MISVATLPTFLDVNTDRQKEGRQERATFRVTIYQTEANLVSRSAKIEVKLKTELGNIINTGSNISVFPVKLKSSGS